MEQDIGLIKETLEKNEDRMTYNDLIYATKKVVKTIEKRLDTFANLEHID
jgi:hypothetical protein